MSAPVSYEQALAVAAAMQQAQQVPDSDRALSVLERMSQQTIGSREQAAEWAKEAIRQLWVFVDPYDGVAVQDFTVKAAQVMQAAQTMTARVTAAAQAQQLAAMGVQVTAVPTAPVDVRASGIDISNGTADLVHDASRVDYQEATVEAKAADSTTQEIFNRPARTYRFEQSRGGSVEVAESAALRRIDSLVDDNLMLTQRLAEHEALAQAADLDSRVIGYRRVIHPELSRGGVCGMCVAASDRMYKIRDLKAIHARCKCTVAAVTREFDPADHLNTVDLERIYGDAFGNTVRDLKRTRYQVDAHGELGAVLVPKAKRKSRTKADLPKRDANATSPEASAEFALKQISVMEATLERLLAAGVGEDNAAVQYNRRMVAQFREKTSATRG